MEIRLSVIIPTYNREALLCETLKNVLEYRAQYHELIVVDQTKLHEDATRKFLETLAASKDIVYVTQDFPNLPEARNTGLKKASGNLILFLDDDVSIGKNFISAHIARHRDPETGCVTGKAEIQNRNRPGNAVLDNASPVKTALKKGLFFFLRKRASYVGRFGVISNFSGLRFLPADTAIGCNMSFKREIFDACGFFDGNYTGNAVREDTDMSIRVRKNGYKIYYDPEAALVHFMENSGGSRAAESGEYWRVFFRNQCYFYIKNFNSGKFLLKGVLFFDLRRCKKNGLDEKKIFALSYLEALELVKG
jgi:GT2 family glycosyltransferase